MTSDMYSDAPHDYPPAIDPAAAPPVASNGPDVDELWPVLDWHGLWQTTSEEVQWLCEPLLERGRSAVLYSAPKAGKSLLSLEVAAGLSAGRSVLGNPPRARLTVLYVDLENSGADVRERLQALGYGPDDLDRLKYLSFPTMAAMDTPAGGNALVRVVDRHDADLVVIDTVSRVISGEENTADTWASLYRYALVPLKGRNVTVLRLDHSGKDVERGQRGSSAKSADVDHVWRLTASGDRVSLVREASRTGHGADRLELDRRTDPLRHLPTTQSHADPRVEMLVQALDAAGIPPTAGANISREAIRGAGHNASNDLVAKVVRARKARSNLSRTGEPVEDNSAPATPVPEQTTLDDVSAGQTCPGQVPDRSGQDPAGQGGADLSPSPPLKRGQGRATPPQSSGDDA